MYDEAAIWAARTGNTVRLVSANDHDHARRSAHYRNKAVDFHATDLEGLANWMEWLGYRVLWRVRGHWNHVHVEQGE